MRIRQLESFIAACELGSISRAADKLYIAQPALGLQIRGLEDDIGVQLLERHARGVQPTEAGKLVLEWARETVGSKARLKDRLRRMAAGATGHVTLGLTPSIAAAFALPILTAAQDAFPSVRLQMVEGRNQVLRDGSQAGGPRVDLALAFDSAGSLPDGDCLLTERLYFVAASGAESTASTPAARGHVAEPIALAEVVEHPLVMPASQDSLRQCAEHGARQLGVTLAIKYEVQSTAVVLALARHGLASAILPLALASDAVREGWLSARPIVSPTLTRHLRWLRSSDPAGGELVPLIQRLVASTIQREIASGPLQDAYVLRAGN